MEKILDAAQYIFSEYKNISGENIDQLKLHKLLYRSLINWTFLSVEFQQ